MQDLPQRLAQNRSPVPPLPRKQGGAFNWRAAIYDVSSGDAVFCRIDHVAMERRSLSSTTPCDRSFHYWSRPSAHDNVGRVLPIGPFQDINFRGHIPNSHRLQHPFHIFIHRSPYLVQIWNQKSESPTLWTINRCLQKLLRNELGKRYGWME